MMIKGKKVVFYTLGCKLNFSETSTIGRELAKHGVVKAQDGEIADIIVVNTCSVTDQADKKCRQAIKKLINRNPGAYVIVVGCYAQLKPDEVASIEGVNIVLSAKDKFNVEKYLEHLDDKILGETHPCEIKEIKNFHTSYSLGDRTRCFLKVQDGCDYFCTYCTIPYARGRSRNMSIEETVKEVNEIADRNIKEIVLTGINTGDFGKSTGESFIDLIKALDEVEKIERFRISSVEPNLLSDEVIEFVASSKKFAPHFHIPLQSGSDEVLKLMRRRYDTALFAHRIEKIKELMPDAFIGVDVIVGMRGETEEYFNDAFEFIKGLDVSQLHVFPYSERAGTKALDIDYVVPIHERKLRAKKLIELSENKLSEFYERFTGKKVKVLFEEGNNKEFMSGFSENYIRVEHKFDPELVNKVVEVELTGLKAEHDGDNHPCVQNCTVL
jgi:threonylcarbamoyladenosine tRNA methylthiotransferase MtaB